MKAWVGIGLLVGGLYSGVYASSEIAQLCADERASALRTCLEDESKTLPACEKEATEAVQFNPGCEPTSEATLATSNDPAVALQRLKADFEKDF
jgi:hypothetical protein